MRDRDTLAALIARVEAATGPDREVDARIYILTTGGSAADADYAATDPGVTCNPPRYTASLDAALTLVPEGWVWSLDSSERFDKTPFGRAAMFGPSNQDTGECEAATPALALTAAALRARLAQMESDAP